MPPPRSRTAHNSIDRISSHYYVSILKTVTCQARAPAAVATHVAHGAFNPVLADAGSEVQLNSKATTPRREQSAQCAHRCDDDYDAATMIGHVCVCVVSPRCAERIDDAPHPNDAKRTDDD